ncbi:hypothetical protein KCP77_11395 [Salmonella enterica subsp. enterica]|nr:hypothetical protein KCP77_11395 [Salmonella enterica subsp. enterica]
MQDTHFETVHGLMRWDNIAPRMIWPYSPAIIHGEPEFYHMYSEKKPDLENPSITQQNRNGLLWDKTMHIDGLKTGHTSGADLVLSRASAVDGQRRLIAVVMGAKKFGKQS